MSKHAGNTGSPRVPDGQRGAAGERARVMPVYDATVSVGLRTIVFDAAIERIENDGEVTIEMPKPDELVAVAAVARCLVPIKLKGCEMRAIRKILKLTLADMAKRMDERTAPETVARWESEAQPMGVFAEKLFRLIVCEELSGNAPGVDYAASAIAQMKVRDPWKTEPNHDLPIVALWLVQLKAQSGSIIEAWNVKQAA